MKIVILIVFSLLWLRIQSAIQIELAHEIDLSVWQDGHRFMSPEWSYSSDVRYAKAFWNPSSSMARNKQKPVIVRSDSSPHYLFLTVAEGMTLNEFMDIVTVAARIIDMPEAKAAPNNRISLGVEDMGFLPAVFDKHFFTKTKLSLLRMSVNFRA